MSRQLKIGAILSYLNIIIKNLVNFIYTPLLLRYVGQANYGLFQMTNSVIVSLSILSLGLSSAYVKFYISYKVKKKEEDIQRLNGLYLLLFCFIGIISIFIGLILAFNTKYIFSRSLTLDEIKLTRELMIILALNLSLTFPSSVFDSNILANEKFRFQQFRQLIQIIAVPVISIPLIMNGFGVITIGIVQTCITVLFLILNIHYCLTHLRMKFKFTNISSTLFKSLISFSFFILLNQVVDIINNNVPSFVLGIVAGAKDVAIFAIAIQIKNMFFMLSTSLSTLFIPRVNHIVNESGDKKALTDIMVKVGRIQMNILFFIMGGFIILGPYFIEKWAGKENYQAYYLILIMVVPSIIPLSQNIGIEIQRAFNMHVFRSITYTIFAIISLFITYLGVSVFGILGASFGYAFSIVLANGILMNWYYHYRMHLNMRLYWKSILNVTYPFIVVTTFLKCITYYVSISSLVIFILFGLVYSLLYIIMFWLITATDFERQIFILKIEK